MANTTREQLDKLQRAQRRAIVWAVLGGAGFLVLLATTFYILYVPGKSREVRGTVISFETDTRSSQIRHFIHVQLDNGNQVRAENGPQIVAKPSSRVRLKATTMPILEIERYSFIAFEAESGVLDKVLR